MGYVLSGAAVRLEDMAKITNNQVKKGMIEALYKTKSILKWIPFKPSNADKMTGVRLTVDDLPADQPYGQYNVIPEPSRTTIRQHQEGSFLIRDRFEIDVRYLEGGNDQIVDPVELQIKGILTKWEKRLNTDFIYGNPFAASADIGSLIGLQTRLDNPAKWEHAADCKIDFGGVNLSASMTKQNAVLLFRYVDLMLDRLDAPDGAGVIVFCNSEFLRAFDSALKIADAGSGLATDQNNYDRSTTTYKKARFVDIGRKADPLESPIVPIDEQSTGTGTGGNTTSIYAIKFGDTDCVGWHDGEWDLKKAGNPTGFAQGYKLDYKFGLYHATNRTIARGYNIRVS